jgi:hypothetical protein
MNESEPVHGGGEPVQAQDLDALLGHSVPPDEDEGAVRQSEGQAALAWIEAVLEGCGSVCRRGRWQCPAHATDGDYTPSLTLKVGKAGHVLIRCWTAGCDYREVLQALLLPVDVLYEVPATSPHLHVDYFLRGLVTFPPPKVADGEKSRAATSGSPHGLTGFVRNARHGYARREELRKLAAVKVRYRHADGRKTVRWESYDEFGGRHPGLYRMCEADLALYFQHWIRPGRRVVLCESESSVDALRKAGVRATTWPGGAGSPPLDYLVEVLGGHQEDVLIVPDHDEAGLECSAKLRSVLPGAAVLYGDPGEDARDLLNRLGPGVFS